MSTTTITLDALREGDELVLHLAGQRIVVAELPPRLELTQRVAELINIVWGALPAPRPLSQNEVRLAIMGFEV